MAPILSFIVMGAIVRFVFRQYGGKGVVCLWAGCAAFALVAMACIK